MPKDSNAPDASPGVTRRVVALCLALAGFFGYVIPVIDVKLSNTFLGAAHLPPGAIAVLLVLLLVISPLMRLSGAAGRRWLLAAGAAALAALSALAFQFWSAASFWAWGFAALAALVLVSWLLGPQPLSRNETLTVYITCLFSCLVPGHGAENFFISNLLGPFYYATPENKWLEFLQRYLPTWFTPALTPGHQYAGLHKAAVENWYTGLRAGEAIPWHLWLVPLAAWGAFVLASYTMLGCLSVMLRAQWAEREALAFPLLRLPMQLTEGTGGAAEPNTPASLLAPFFRNPLMWVGFGIALVIQLLNGLNVYFPDVPQVPLSIDTGPLFTEAPWNQIGWTPMQVYPIAVGITYLLTSEVSFSLWFFYWLIRFQLIVAYYLGFLPTTLPAQIGSTAQAKVFNGYQQVGCYFAYVAIVLWTGREHIRHIVRRAVGRERAGEGERAEPLPYPVAFWGFVLSFLFMVGWSIAAGMSPPVALALWLVYLVIALALTRLVVEGGLLFVQQGWVPMGMMAQLVNSGPGTLIASNNVVVGTFLQGALITDLRAFIMPSFMQSFKLAHERRISARPLLALIAAVVLITLTMSFWMNVRLGYLNGGLTLESWFAVGGAQKPANDITPLLDGVRDVSWTNWLWLALGMATTWGMMMARSRFLWFPLHPLGFLMCLTYPMNRLWFSIFLGWMCKTSISRFGGSESYRKTTPMFLGLALGDVAMMIFWLIIDGWQGRTHHQLMPG